MCRLFRPNNTLHIDLLHKGIPIVQKQNSHVVLIREGGTGDGRCRLRKQSHDQSRDYSRDYLHNLPYSISCKLKLTLYYKSSLSIKYYYYNNKKNKI